MFWFLNTDSVNGLEFNQIFNHYTKYQDVEAGCVNNIYNFTSGTIEKIINKNNLKDVIPKKFIFDIKIKDNYIQYFADNLMITFKTKCEFIKEGTEEFNNDKPFFKWKYVKTSNHKLPLINKKNYDYYYENVIFYVYTINKNKLFVIEQINDNVKEYYLEKLN